MTTIVLWVSDLNKSASFYADLFEVAKPEFEGEFVSVAGNGNEVLLHLLPEEYRSEPSYGEDNPIKPVFRVSSIDSVRKVAQEHNCEFKSDVMQYGSNSYLDGKDPDGHVIQVAAS
jgi:predicted lactoylglutathione lyase